MIKNFKHNLPFYFAACWSLLFLANFVPTFPQPNAIIGYLWKVEFALAAFLSAAIILIYKFGVKSAFKISRNEFVWILLPMLLFTAWSGISVFWSESVRSAIHHTLLWSCYLIFYLLVRQIVSNPRNLDFSLNCAAVVLVIIGVACIVEYTSTIEKIGSNFTFRYYKYAEIAATLFPFFLIGALKSKNSKSILSGAVALVCWALIVLCLSRTILIAGLTAIILVFGLILLKPNRKIYFKKSLILIFSIIAVFAASQFNSSSSSNTIQRFGNDKHANSTIDFRYLSWGFAIEQLKSAPITGVGADNYGTEYKSARENLSKADAENKLLESSEVIIPERAHNEFLQILAELGIVGFLFFGFMLFGVLRIAFNFRKRDFSIVSIAAFASIAAFLVSSLASSYSFRVPANGLCFFFALAVLVQSSKFKVQSSSKNQFRNLEFGIWNFKPLFIASLFICAAMLAFSAVRGVSLMYLQNAMNAENQDAAETAFQKAMKWDASDAMFRYYYGGWLYRNNRAAEAAPQIRFGIERGIASSVAYFELASTQIVQKQTVEAEKTFAESLQIYPRSVFLRTAYASFLEDCGNVSEAAKQYEKAAQINLEQSRSWRLAFAEGMSKLSETEGQNKDFVKVMDLMPGEGIYALLDFQRQARPNLVRR